MSLFRRRRPLRWHVATAAPKGEAGEQWGDTWFARDLVDALQRAGEQAQVVHHKRAQAVATSRDDVVVVLRGLKAVEPCSSMSSVSNGATWLLWVISHPELVTAQEAASYDAVLAASASWQAPGGVTTHPLLQATNPRRFTPDAAAPDSGEPVLFVGSTRGQFRPIVRDAIAAGAPIGIWGVGWEDVVDPALMRGSFLPNPDLPAAYAGAGVVLNDHWPDMAAQGFVSNRLFDAVATGTRVVSDDALGLHDVFGAAVRTYDTPADLAVLLGGERDAISGDRAARLDAARMVAAEHSFDVRARDLVAHARRLRGERA